MLVTVTNNQATKFACPPPVARTIPARGEIQVHLSQADLDSEPLATLQQRGLITCTPATNTQVPDAVQPATKQDIDDLQAGNVVSTTSLTTSDATVTTILSIAVPTATTEQIMVRASGRDQAGSVGGSYVFVGTFRNDAGTVTQIGSTTALVTHEDTGAWACDFAVSGTNVLVRVTGVAAHTIHWKAGATLVKVS